MNVLVVGDVHWSQTSSIVRRFGDKYSIRLEHLINSVNWVEQIAQENNCEKIVFLGDFFDRTDLTAMELTALQEISWSTNISHYFICGNHEMARQDLSLSSAHLFNLIHDCNVIDTPLSLAIDNNTSLHFVPYILEENRKNSISDYIISNVRNIIFSHNDLRDFQMGRFKSENGFAISDIQANCDLYLNGHLHNGSKVADKIINVGNLCGQNFSENAFEYYHSAILLNTETLSCAVFDNPHALNFYKLDFTEKSDIDYINHVSLAMGKNCVATIKCFDEDLDYLRARFDPNYRTDNLPYNCNMVETRFIIVHKETKIVKDKEETISINHLEQFKNYMIDLLGDLPELQEELLEVCK